MHMLRVVGVCGKDECKNPLLWKPIIFTLFNKITKLDDSKAYWSLDEQQIISRLHSADHDVIIFRYTKCSFGDMFILLKDESNIFILTLEFTFESCF